MIQRLWIEELLVGDSPPVEILLSAAHSEGVTCTSFPSPVSKYTMKMNEFGFSETKLFHFHGIFQKNEIELAKRTPTPLYILGTAN